MSEISEFFGACPRPFDYIFSDPKLFWKLVFGPDVPYTYRLIGSKHWSGARDAILGVEERFIQGLQPQKSPKELKKFSTNNTGLYLIAGAFLFLLLLWLLY